MIKNMIQNILGNNYSEEEYILEIENLKNECNELIDVIHQKDEKINKLYNELEEMSKKIKSIQNSTKIDNNLLDKLDQEIKKRDNKIKELENENAKIKIELNLLKESKTVLPEEIENVETIEFNFKILINDFFPERKFEKFKKECALRNFVYIDDILKYDISMFELTDIKLESVNERLTEYKEKKFDKDIIEYLKYGDKISKVFFRYRSFVKYCKEKGLENIIELENFDFNTLLENGFKEAQIEKIKDRYNEYMSLRKKGSLSSGVGEFDK
jgi:chromosome segregation ATPase